MSLGLSVGKACGRVSLGVSVGKACGRVRLGLSVGKACSRSVGIRVWMPGTYVNVG